MNFNPFLFPSRTPRFSGNDKVVPFNRGGKPSRPLKTLSSDRRPATSSNEGNGGGRTARWKNIAVASLFAAIGFQVIGAIDFIKNPLHDIGDRIAQGLGEDGPPDTASIQIAGLNVEGTIHQRGNTDTDYFYGSAINVDDGVWNSILGADETQWFDDASCFRKRTVNTFASDGLQADAAITQVTAGGQSFQAYIQPYQDENGKLFLDITSLSELNPDERIESSECDIPGAFVRLTGDGLQFIHADDAAEFLRLDDAAGALVDLFTEDEEPPPYDPMTDFRNFGDEVREHEAPENGN